MRNKFLILVLLLIPLAQAGEVSTRGGNLNMSGNLTVDNTIFHVDSNSDDIGIGTVNPNLVGWTGTVLTIEDLAQSTIEMWMNSDSIADGQSSRLSFLAGTSGNRITEITSEIEGTSENSGHLILKTMNAGSLAEIVRIASSGYVGIGQPEPQRLLHVQGSQAWIYVNSTGDQAAILLDAASGQDPLIQLREDGLANWTIASDVTDSGKFKIRTSTNAGTEMITIDQLGNVGIGTTAPNQKLHVIGSANISQATYINATSCDSLDTDANGQIICGTDAAGGGGGQGLWIDSTPYTYLNESYEQNLNLSDAAYINATTGFIGVNTTTPDFALDVQGSVNAVEFIGDGSQITGLPNQSLNYVYNGTTFIGARASADGVLQLDITSQDADSASGSLTVTQDLTVDTNTLYVDSTNNNVGIGTTSPGRRLMVHDDAVNTVANFSSGDANAGIELNDNTAGVTLNTNAGDFSIGTNNTGADFYVSASGAVGIGTSSPGNHNLHVMQGSANEMIRFESTTTSGPVINLDGSGAFDGRYWEIHSGGSANAVVGGAGYFGIVDRNASAARLVINSSGAIGIGTTNPGDLLTIAGQINISSEGHDNVEIAASTGGHFNIYNYESASLHLGTAGVARVSIDSSGNLGVGTTDPGTALHVVGSANISGGVYTKDTNGDADIASIGSNAGSTAILQNEIFTFDTNSAKFFTISDGGGNGALVFADYVSSTISLISNPSSKFQASSTPSAGTYGIYKSANSHTISVESNVGSTQYLSILVIGDVSGVTDPS